MQNMLIPVDRRSGDDRRLRMERRSGLERRVIPDRRSYAVSG